MNSPIQLTWPILLLIIFLVAITVTIILIPQTQTTRPESFCQSTFIDTPYPSKPLNLQQPTSTNTTTEPKHNLILYYAMWCGNCKNFIPTWSQFDEWAKTNLKNVRVSSVRCEDGNEATCSQKGIQGYPTVMLYLKDGSERMFEGPRTVEGLKKFIDDYAK